MAGPDVKANVDRESIVRKFGDMTPDEFDYLVERVAERVHAKINIEEIAENAAKTALNLVYQEVGKSVLRKVAWAVGVGLLGLLTWLGFNGHIK